MPPVHVPLTLAALGRERGVRDAGRPQRDLSIAAGTHSGAVIQLKGTGRPEAAGPGPGRPLRPRAGGHAHRVSTSEQRELLAALAEARGEELGEAPQGEGLFSKLRSALS